jgi:hypothetical protein
MIALRNTPGWSSLIEKVEAIRRETDQDRQQMLYDSLIVECSKRLKSLREILRWHTEIDHMIDRLVPVQGAEKVDALITNLRDIKRRGQVGSVDALWLRVREMIESEEHRLEVQKKREAILQSLQELGYETSEGLETAFVQAGKLVFRKPDEAEYAVEVAVNNDCSLLQTAMLRYADSLESSQQQRLRDTAKEETWCNDHALFLDGLAKRGLATAFKMKRRPGDVPMRVVIDKTRVEARRRAAAPSARSQEASRE